MDDGPSGPIWGFDGLPTGHEAATETPKSSSMPGYGLSSLLSTLRIDAPGWNLVRSKWECQRAITAGQTVRHELIVTRVRNGITGGSVLNTRVRLIAGNDTLEQGSCEFTSPEIAGIDAEDRFQFCTVEWGRQLVSHLSNDDRFTDAISAYDGTLGLSDGVNEVHFRLYRGTIVEVTHRAIHGADFTLSAEDHVWLGLILGERNDFMDRAMKGEFRTSGSGYEYLRMTKALVFIIDAARAASREGGTR
ncbi:hypothetical protein [Glaciibacter superstes]|uniref:hypothetical protein n=1 Tax=Glaciibacter superstes TaxID=501023 RepID=UPI0003B429C6|nr:hypothetical protein [Glaciibacter superstes]